MTHPHKAGKSLLAKNTILNLIGQVLPMLVAVSTIPYIIRGLGETGYGILSIAFLVLGYFSIFDLGLSRATVKFVAENLTPDKVHKIPELVWTSLALLIGLGGLFGAIAAAFVPLAVTHFMKMPPSFVSEAKASLFILCASMPVMLGNDALRGVLEATQRFDLVNYVKVPGSICFYLFAALAIPFGFKVPGIVFILVFVRFITACIYLVQCLRVIPVLRGRFRLSRESIRPLAQYGGWVMVSNITQPISGNVERFLIASVLSVSALTYYSVPLDLVAKIGIFPASIAPALFPYFSYHGKQGGEHVSDVTSRSIKYLLLVLVPLTAVFAVFAGDILQIWLGAQFAARSTAVMQIVAIMYLINSLAYIPYASVQALGRPDLKATLDLLAIPAYVVASWFLMNRFGIAGAAFARLLMTVLDCAFLYWFALRMKAFSLKDCASGPLSRALISSVVLFLAVVLIHAFHFNVAVSAVLLLVVFAGYTVVFWFTAVDSQERVTLLTLLQGVPFALRGRRTPVAQKLSD
jgi:O-antigen/teichoic acid export membrane protein